MLNATFIQISVGSLPEWYVEEEHDSLLENAIERNWRSNPACANAEIRIAYNYQTDDAVVTAYDDDGNVVFERRNHNIDYAFDYVKNNSWSLQFTL